MTEAEIFVPGRLCILGEHSDWAAKYRSFNPLVAPGMCLVCTTNEGLYSRCSRLDELVLTYSTATEERGGERKEISAPLEVEWLTAEASKGTFFSYIYGTTAALLQHLQKAGTPLQHGIAIDNYKTTLPMRKGLSSSAAICVTIAKCFNAVYKLQLDRDVIMEIAFCGEMMTPSKCGRMDQCVAMGSGVALMQFSQDRVVMRQLHNHSDLHFVVADLKSTKNTIKILNDLNDCFPEAVTKVHFKVHSYMNSNIGIAWNAIDCIETGNISSLADYVNEAQRSFDENCMGACPDELTAPKLHAIMKNKELAKLALAIKGVGSQGDGTVQVLCESADKQRQAMDLLNKQLECEAFTLIVPATKVKRSAKGAAGLLLSQEVPVFAVIKLDFSTKDPEIINKKFEELVLDLVANGVKKIACFIDIDTVDKSTVSETLALFFKRRPIHMSNSDRIDEADSLKPQSSSSKPGEPWVPKTPDFEGIFNSFSLDPNASAPNPTVTLHDKNKEVFMMKQRCLKMSLYHTNKVHTEMIKDNLEYFDNSVCYDNRSSILEAVAKATKTKAKGESTDEPCTDEFVDKNGLKNVLFCDYGCSTSGMFDVIDRLVRKKESQVNNISLISKNDIESKFILK